jgi:hypothetical protein
MPAVTTHGAQRQHPRLRGAWRVRWSDRHGTHAAKATDLGIGGCCLATGFLPPSRAAAVQVEFSMPPSRTLTLSGRVAWVEYGTRFGVQFDDADEQRQAIAAMLVEAGLADPFAAPPPIDTARRRRPPTD